MRVGVVGYPVLSERQWKLCRLFEERGVETHLFLPREWPGIPESDHPPSDAPFEVHSHRTVFTGYMGRYVMPGLPRTLRSVAPDVLLTHGEPWHLVTAEAQAAGDLLGVAHVDFSWENLDRVPRMGVQRTIERTLLSRIDGMIAGSEAASERLRRRGFDGHLTVAPETGVDTAAFVPGGETDGVREEFGIPPTADVVLYAGRFTPEKGLDTLLDTVEPVCTEHERAHYVLLGDGPMTDDLDERIDAFSDRVTLVTDRQPYTRMPNIYPMASVFAYPSRTVENWSEQFGYAVAEAMSCGVPVVTTDCGSLPYVVGDTGVVCSEEDAPALAKGVQSLLSDEKRRRELGLRARERVEREFSLDSVATAHLDALRAVS